jgi:hypothetical protein
MFDHVEIDLVVRADSREDAEYAVKKLFNIDHAYAYRVENNKEIT